MTHKLPLTVGLLALTASAQAVVVDFEDQGLALNDYDNGSDSAGQFTAGGATFNNSYNTEWGSWSGWSASAVADSTTPGLPNQYAAIPGSGANGSLSYGVAYGSSATVDFGGLVEVDGAAITNTTYAYLSMRDGDSFGKAFGGVDGTDPDFFQLTITGVDGQGQATGSVTVDLADFTGDAASDTILDSWQWVDLADLGQVTGLTFDFASSDVGQWGINTPVYFAMDDLTFTAVPEPAGLAVLGLGLFGVARRRRRQA